MGSVNRDIFTRSLIDQQRLISLVHESSLVTSVASFADTLVKRLAAGSKVLLAGNGGSAAEAQHMAGELVNYFRFQRSGLSAIALTVDSSVITAIANDVDFDSIFSRQIEAIGEPGDVLWCYTTSGKSTNILRAIDEARRKKIVTAVFCGSDDSNFEADFKIAIPSKDTPRIQEIHTLLGHSVCEAVEQTLFPRP